MISAIRSPDSDRRMSRINEGRSPDVDRRTSYELKSFSNQTEIEQLESKLANANSLIEGLERQIDDTTSQKNDALVSEVAERLINCNTLHWYTSSFSFNCLLGLD